LGYFETTVSTSGDVETTVLLDTYKETVEKDGRNYFHYKMDQKMLNFYAYNSSKIMRITCDKWKKCKYRGVLPFGDMEYNLRANDFRY
jgi:ABC-2 type transport system permease protein